MALPKLKKMPNDGIILSQTPGDIIECAFEGDIQGVDRELEKDPLLINARRDGTGVTPLMAAAGSGLRGMVAHLLTKDGIDPRLRDDFGYDAIMHARFFPDIVGKLTSHMYPNARWQEPDIKPL